MKVRKLLLFIFIIFFSIVLSACSYNDNNLSLNDLEESFYHSGYESSDIKIHIQNDTITSTTDEIILSYENISNKEYTYDEKITLEVEIDNVWYTIPIENYSLLKASSSFILLPKHTYKDEFYISNHIKELIPGKYRIIKKFKHDNNESFSSIEFNII